jgi:hypothetical protein
MNKNRGKTTYEAYSNQIPGNKIDILLGNAVAITKTRALTALHGRIPVGTKVTVITRHGKTFKSTLVFEKFQKDCVDIAVLQLSPGDVFDAHIPISDKCVHVEDEIHVVGLREVNTDYEMFSRVTRVELIENRIGSTLFQSSYYSTAGDSGAGVVTVLQRKWFSFSSELAVVGVHVASHDSTVGMNKTTVATVKNMRADLQTISSQLHGHSAYTLVCETLRIPEVINFLATN